MNRLSALLIICLGLLLGMPSCKKESNEPAGRANYVTLRANRPFQYNLGQFGIEDGASIYVQAQYFQVSNISRVHNGDVVYNYVPAYNYLGKDTVVIRSVRGSAGATPGNDIAYTTLYFTIRN